MQRSAVRIIRDEAVAKLLTDPMRREILRLLADDVLTETELSDILGLSLPSVGYHLKALLRSGLIFVARRELEEHGIVQKFYQTKALVHIIDLDNMPLYIRRYLTPVQLERARGMLAGLSIEKGTRLSLSSDFIEKFASSLAKIVVKAAEKYEGSPASGDPEGIINSVYREALRELSKDRFLAPRLHVHV